MLLRTIEHHPSGWLLSQAGYVSQLICDCPHLFRANFNVGFDGAYVLRGQEGDTFFLRMNHPIESVMPPEKTRYGKHFQGHNLPDLACWTNRLWIREEELHRGLLDWLKELDAPEEALAVFSRLRFQE